ncbi:MAG: hypothetical protein WC499_02195 [Patescibacteria group bacterium]
MTKIEILTFILALTGALAWLPSIVELFKHQKLFGKIISRYDNYNDTQTFFLFKLSILLKNKSFNIREIECLIKYEDNQIFSDKARNMRKIIFNRNEELGILGKDFINNLAILPNDQNIVGYLFFTFEHVKKETKIIKTTFIFRSFENKEIKLVFDEKDIDGKQLFYDDSIWNKK